MEATDTRRVYVGDAVLVSDEDRNHHFGLVTYVHDSGDQEKFPDPTINVTYTSDDPAQHDPYGRQIVRLSSLQHRSKTSAGGRYWDYLDITTPEPMSRKNA